MGRKNNSYFRNASLNPKNLLASEITADSEKLFGIVGNSKGIIWHFRKPSF